MSQASGEKFELCSCVRCVGFVSDKPQPPPSRRGVASRNRRRARLRRPSVVSVRRPSVRLFPRINFTFYHRIVGGCFGPCCNLCGHLSLSAVCQAGYPCHYLQYRAEKKPLQILLSRTQAGPGRIVKQQQEEMSRNHVPRLFLSSVSLSSSIADKMNDKRCRSILTHSVMSLSHLEISEEAKPLTHSLTSSPSLSPSLTLLPSPAARGGRGPRPSEGRRRRHLERRFVGLIWLAGRTRLVMTADAEGGRV